MKTITYMHMHDLSPRFHLYVESFKEIMILIYGG